MEIFEGIKYPRASSPAKDGLLYYFRLHSVILSPASYSAVKTCRGEGSERSVVQNNVIAREGISKLLR